MMANKTWKKVISVILTVVMVFGMINIGVFAADAPEMVQNFSDTYYHQDGTAGTAEDWEIHLSKTAAPTATENIFDITLVVETKDTSIELAGTTHGAVTLVLDVSNSMGEGANGCAVCGESENHANHQGESNLCPDGSGNSYERSGFGGSSRCIAGFFGT